VAEEKMDDAMEIGTKSCDLRIQYRPQKRVKVFEDLSCSLEGVLVVKRGVNHVLRMVGICFHFPKDSRSLHNPLDRVLQLRHLRLLDAAVV